MSKKDESGKVATCPRFCDFLCHRRRSDGHSIDESQGAAEDKRLASNLGPCCGACNRAPFIGKVRWARGSLGPEWGQVRYEGAAKVDFFPLFAPNRPTHTQFMRSKWGERALLNVNFFHDVRNEEKLSNEFRDRNGCTQLHN